MNKPAQTVSAHEALIYAMVTLSAADRTMTDRELMAIGDIVKTLPIFQGFADDELARLAERVRERRLRPGEVLFAQGEAGHECFVILQGEVEVVGRQNQAELRLQVAGAGQVVGEMALLDMSPRSATVRALAPSRLAAMDGSSALPLTRMLGRGGSSSRMTRSISSNAALRRRLRSSGVVPVSSS